MKRFLTCLLLLLGANVVGHAANLVPDVAREQRWAEEIVPKLRVGDAVNLTGPTRNFLALHTIATGGIPTEKGALVIIHGAGGNPDLGVVHALRVGLAQAGYTTLSLQMPMPDAKTKEQDYPTLFPDAAFRIAAGVDYLQTNGHQRIGVVSYGLGARMANYYFSKNPRSALFAWVLIGLTGGLDSSTPLNVPVMDVIGEKSGAAALSNAVKRWDNISSTPLSVQIVVPGADANFTRKEKELVEAIRVFLDRVVAGR